MEEIKKQFFGKKNINQIVKQNVKKSSLINHGRGEQKRQSTNKRLSLSLNQK